MWPMQTIARNRYQTKPAPMPPLVLTLSRNDPLDATYLLNGDERTPLYVVNTRSASVSSRRSSARWGLRSVLGAYARVTTIERLLPQLDVHTWEKRMSGGRRPNQKRRPRPSPLSRTISTRLRSKWSSSSSSSESSRIPIKQDGRKRVRIATIIRRPLSILHPVSITFGKAGNAVTGGAYLKRSSLLSR